MVVEAREIQLDGGGNREKLRSNIRQESACEGRKEKEGRERTKNGGCGEREELMTSSRKYEISASLDLGVFRGGIFLDFRAARLPSYHGQTERVELWKRSSRSLGYLVVC